MVYLGKVRLVQKTYVDLLLEGKFAVLILRASIEY